MYVGRMVELAETEALYHRPLHPYTEALLSAAPTPSPDAASTRIILEREIADPANPPPGCPFHPRCRYAEARCRSEVPAFEEIEPGRHVACLRARELSLKGIADLS
jgi:peptide/nickel transport system ATP-binding protein